MDAPRTLISLCGFCFICLFIFINTCGCSHLSSVTQGSEGPLSVGGLPISSTDLSLSSFANVSRVTLNPEGGSVDASLCRRKQVELKFTSSHQRLERRHLRGEDLRDTEVELLI